MQKQTAIWFLLTIVFICAEMPSGYAKSNQKSLNAALLKAVQEGETKKARALLRQGASVNAENKDGNGPIMIAADVDESPYQYGPPHSLALFKLLLSYKPDVNVKNKMGGTALIIAASTGSSDAVKLLVQRGAQVNAKGNEGGTALMGACYSQGEGEEYASPNIVEYLLAHGADANAKDKVIPPSNRTILW